MKTLLTAILSLTLACGAIAGPHSGRGNGGHFSGRGAGHSHFNSGGGHFNGGRGHFGGRFHGNHFGFRHGYYDGEIIILDDGCWFWNGFQWVVYEDCE